MSAIGPSAFAVFAWGTIAAVLLVFGYEIYAVAREYGVLGDSTDPIQ
jgi:hypothetical protein